MVQSTNFESRINSLDLSLFEGIPSQSFDEDRRSWLALQRAVRSSDSGYVYLEIGSHLGGSIQQHLLDPKCRKIFSLDKRPLEHPDNRGPMDKYPGNSTARMMHNLRSVAADMVDKVVCFDTDARDLEPSLIDEAPDLCFIDGEHTTSAVISDFLFCLRVVKPNGVVCFHDDWIVVAALEEVSCLLRNQDIPFTPLKLGGISFGIFLRDSTELLDPLIRSMASDGRKWLRRRELIDYCKRSCPIGLLPLVRSAARWCINSVNAYRW
jgi:hypothetical protein